MFKGMRVQRVAFTPVVRRARLVLSLRSYSTPVRTPKSKVWASADEAVESVKSGDVLLCGGERHLCRRVTMVLAIDDVDRIRACRCPRCGSSDASGRIIYSLYVSPDTLLAALVKRKDVVNLTAVSNNAGAGNNGLGACETPTLHEPADSVFHRNAIQYQADRQDRRIIPRRVSRSLFPTTALAMSVMFM
jgi:hypothetical protein